MSRSNNSRKGSRRGNWKCGCCFPRIVKIQESLDQADREGRTADEDGKFTMESKKFCDWDR